MNEKYILINSRHKKICDFISNSIYKFIDKDIIYKEEENLTKYLNIEFKILMKDIDYLVKNKILIKYKDNIYIDESVKKYQYMEIKMIEREEKWKDKYEIYE